MTLTPKVAEQNFIKYTQHLFLLPRSLFPIGSPPSSLSPIMTLHVNIRDSKRNLERNGKNEKLSHKIQMPPVVTRIFEVSSI